MRFKKFINEEDFEQEVMYNQNPEMYLHFRNLTEMFNSKIPIEVIEKDELDFKTRFQVEKRSYLFHAKQTSKDLWGVMFFSTNSDPFTLMRLGINVGDVFSGVFDSLQLLVSSYNVKEFYFNTKEPKLKRLYNSLIRTIEGKTKFKFKNEVENGEYKSWFYENPNYEI